MVLRPRREHPASAGGCRGGMFNVLFQTAEVPAGCASLHVTAPTIEQ